MGCVCVCVCVCVAVALSLPVPVSVALSLCAPVCFFVVSRVCLCLPATVGHKHQTEADTDKQPIRRCRVEKMVGAQTSYVRREETQTRTRALPTPFLIPLTLLWIAVQQSQG